MKKFPFDKRVLITGGGSGLGRALALAFADMGFRVAAADIDSARAAETAALVEKSGGHALPVTCDVTRLKDLTRAAGLIMREFNGVDIVINNAGVAAAGAVEKIPQKQWDWILDINLKSVILGCRVFVPILEAQGGGHIVNTASAAGFASLPEMSCYNVTKAGVISLSETLRVELAPKNIGVTVVTPTFFKTNLMDQFKSTDARQRKMAQAFFNKSMATSEDVARHVIRSIKKNRLYVVTQPDGKFIWMVKRMFPQTYFDTLGYFYKKGLLDRFMNA